ncbi:MAG: Transcriptional regulator, LysR family, partial [uncultured Sphingomonadaceae bacterium]
AALATTLFASGFRGGRAPRQLQGRRRRAGGHGHRCQSPDQKPGAGPRSSVVRPKDPP